MSGATIYTIVNDVTTIASKLPQFPTLESTAIMRHVKSRKLKDYVFRPFYVKSALMCLIANNHLYKDVSIEYSTEQDWNDISASTVVPFLPPSLRFLVFFFMVWVIFRESMLSFLKKRCVGVSTKQRGHFHGILEMFNVRNKYFVVPLFVVGSTYFA